MAGMLRSRSPCHRWQRERRIWRSAKILFTAAGLENPSHGWGWSIFSRCITALYGSCSDQDRNKLQRVVNVAQSITQTRLLSIDSVYTSHCLGKAASIIKYPTHPGHSLFHLLPSGKRWKSLRSRTTDSRTVSSLLPSDFWMDLPHIKLIFLYTLAMTVTLHSAPSPFLLYGWYVLFV